ncbi:MAG: type 1 glutamine amidotransferase [Pseudomonadales bacterium]|nr:type 1 glutamine amidotransferase [Pseudomonadales bacterium]
MRIHYIQHVPFESLGCMRDYLLSQGHTLSSSRMYEHCILPKPEDFDFLIIMGGPMGVYDQQEHPWLADEISFIRICIELNKIVLGICLGAQLIASALGADVRKNRFREIGWHEVTLDKRPLPGPWARIFPARFSALHWHGDTFSIPDNASPLGSSEACLNQGFFYGKTVVALQFHLEMTHDSVSKLIQRCGHELENSHYVQTADTILANRKGFDENNRVIMKLLDYLTGANP